MKLDYPKFLAECIKAGGQMIIDNAEDIAGKTPNISDLSITLYFDQEDSGSIPRMEITRSHWPSRETLEHLLRTEDELTTKNENQKPDFTNHDCSHDYD
jgi:hypothetical protein